MDGLAWTLERVELLDVSETFALDTFELFETFETFGTFDALDAFDFDAFETLEAFATLEALIAEGERDGEACLMAEIDVWRDVPVLERRDR